MKLLKHISIAILMICANVSCTSNDDANTEGINVVKVGDNVYNVNSVIIEPSFNRTFLQLTNKTEVEVMGAINQGQALNNFDVLNITINDDPLGELSYNFNSILNYEFLIDASLEAGDLEGGETLLESGDNHFEATSGSISITYYSVDRIEFSFEFERNDGTLISGGYKGSYIYLDDRAES
ncbi:hypothetical protein [Tamlana crocina]|uniref:DUF4382 domain-containing protein n=1 Tax=Tamlana crocina TaxID=393006 RepID=A0ABX1DD70_9FLAO|nr:hypothetical protein [Tamlana crocina]NJX16290.1 hypothetical protein [Tamlana crocina]